MFVGVSRFYSKLANWSKYLLNISFIIVPSEIDPSLKIVVKFSVNEKSLLFSYNTVFKQG